MKTSTFFVLLLFYFCSLLYIKAQPTNNPVLDKYPSFTDHWSNLLHWNIVTNVNSVSGLYQTVVAPLNDLRFPNISGNANILDSLKLQQTMLTISNNGGGILYFPTGTYIFTFDLKLVDKVILRGETPPSNKQIAINTNFSPPTVFIFPKYMYETSVTVPNTSAFKKIYSPRHCSDLGLVYLTINRASISFRPEWSNVIPESTVYYPDLDATTAPINFIPNITPISYSLPYTAKTYASPQPITIIKNIIVYGVRQLNSAEPTWAADVPRGTQNENQRWPNRRAANIDAFVFENCFVANNRLNDDASSGYANTTLNIASDNFTQPGYKYSSGTNVYNVIYSHLGHYGIVVNRSKLFFTTKTGTANSSFLYSDWMSIRWAHTPDDEPACFGTGVEVRDNWLVNSYRVKYAVSGNGMILDGNIGEQKSYSTSVDPTGTIAPTGAQTFECRGIDFSGWNLTVSNNDVYNFGVLNDGEGILHQESSGSTVNGAKIINNKSNTYFAFYKSKNLNNIVVHKNDIGANMMIQANTNTAKFGIYDATITNNQCTSMTVIGDLGGNNVQVHNNNAGSYAFSCYVNESNNGGTVTWRALTTGATTTGPCIDPNSKPFVAILNPSTDTINSLTGNNLGVYQIRINTYVFPFQEPTNVTLSLYIDNVLVMSDLPDANGNLIYNWSIPNGFASHTINVVANYDTYNSMANSVVKIMYGTPTQLINNFDNHKIGFYPNPVNDILNITNLHHCQAIEIYQTNGKLMYKSNSSIDTDFSISVANFPKGLYILKLRFADKTISRKFVK